MDDQLGAFPLLLKGTCDNTYDRYGKNEENDNIDGDVNKNFMEIHSDGDSLLTIVVQKC